MKLTHLNTDSAHCPLGIDNPRPRLSWQLAGEGRGIIQTAYQVQAAASPDALENGPHLWDSGPVQSSQNTGIVYGGPALDSTQRVYWRARAWDWQGQPTTFSEPTWFEMGLLHPQDWQADWIGFPAGFAGKALYYRKEFTVEQPVLRARLYGVALGYGEFHLNGQVLDQDDHGHKRVLDPAPTRYDRRVLYSTFDVTHLLQQGQNVIGVIAGNGWYGAPKLILHLRITWQDGSETRVVTGKQGQGGSWWRVGQGAVQTQGVFDGETYDATLEDPGWDQPGDAVEQNEFSMRWTGAMVVEAPGGELAAQPLEAMRVVASLPPQAVREVKPGVWVFDFGQNLAGWARLQVQGQRGSQVTLRFAESCYEDGTVNQENLRSARATDCYILRGGGLETWEPRFTYHGFRYVQVEGLPSAPGPQALTARVVRTAVPQAGAFACSDDLLNRIAEMVRWTEGSNLHGIPTDCPQRDERMGWMNDLAARTEEALCNFNLARLFAKFITDIHDSQEPSGAIPDTVPYRWGSLPADPVSVSYLLIPWHLYRWYGDARTLVDHFDGMRAWVDYLASRAEEGILSYSYYGDWAPPVAEAQDGSIGSSAISKATPGPLVSTAFFYYSARLLAQIAETVGSPDLRDHYNHLAETIAQAFHRQFWDEQNGGYGSNNQACNTLALYMGLAPEPVRARVLDNLVADIAAHGDHLTTGNLCTKYLLEVLSDLGRGDVALRLARQTTYPSWGYMIANGATTVWERWEKATGSGMNSHNHPMLASVGSWLVKYAAGLDLQPGAVGFNRLRIAPRVPGLTWAKASLETVQGRVSVEWHQDEDEVLLIAEVPANTHAVIEIPCSFKSYWLYENHQLIDHLHESTTSVVGVGSVSKKDHTLLIEVLPGRYSFTLHRAP